MMENFAANTRTAGTHVARADAPAPARPVIVLAERHLASVTLPLHRHSDRLQLICVTRGMLRVRSVTTMWLVPSGTGVLIPATVPHEVLASDSVHFRAVNISPERLSGVGSCLVIALGQFLAALVDEVAKLSDDHALSGPGSRLTDVLLDQIESAPRRSLTLPRPQDPRAQRVADALFSTDGDRRTLESWGHHVGASRRTLSRIFESETGMSFREYRRQAQLQTAIGLLSDGHAVARVAHSLGYENSSAFIHAFKSATGLTPGQFATQPS
ncbi:MULTISPECIES: AraC family transcriptional regulator [Mycobacterium]|uniref:AraC family transcriptional regulator n=1 Tax=Mycobacterium TaxID=1763 RepID=UPI00200E626C|nr:MULTISPECIES: AraC family transcriptional regulator [Mycobacterium]UQB93134.1 AraC family transcriptional regulator [Mycobacterium intracellulare]WSE46150.1 AraC family transcriptional regulator [Mycobacterium sp. 3-98]